MQALEARALLFQRKLKEVLVEASIPGVPELDGLLSVLELKANDMSHASKLSEVNGVADEILMTAAMVCKSLVLRETKERLCSDLDLEGVASWGMTVLKPLSELVAQACGLTPEALVAAKDFLPATPVSDSSTSSPVNSAEAVPSVS